MKASRTDVVILATAKASPGREAELERALREVAEPTRRQTGCVQFTLFREARDRSTFVACERWTSEEAHQQHLAGAHVRLLMSRMAEVLASPPSIISYEAIDE